MDADGLGDIINCNSWGKVLKEIFLCRCCSEFELLCWLSGRFLLADCSGLDVLMRFRLWAVVEATFVTEIAPTLVYWEERGGSREASRFGMWDTVEFIQMKTGATALEQWFGGSLKKGVTVDRAYHQFT